MSQQDKEYKNRKMTNNSECKKNPRCRLKKNLLNLKFKWASSLMNPVVKDGNSSTKIWIPGL